MELPKINSSSNGVLGGLKGRLGIGKKNADDDQEAYDDYDEYDDYADDYADDYDDGYDDDYDDGYDEPAPSPRGAHQSPNLVSYSDVREHGVPRSSFDDRRPAHAAPADADREPAYQADRPAGSNTTFTSPFEQLDPQPQFQSRGLNSLFDSTDSPTQEMEPVPAPANYQQAAQPAQPAYGEGPRGAYDPYDVYAGAAPAMRSPQRQVTVVRPYSYNEVEQVAKALRAGDAVVLALRATNPDLAKRILDFSFGAASVSGARVDAIGEKVFAIGMTELTVAERQQLMRQGIL